MSELTEYLIELGKMLGIDTDTEGCVNPNLALSARIVLAIDELERPLQWKSVADGLPDAKQNAEAEKLAKLEAWVNGLDSARWANDLLLTDYIAGTEIEWCVQDGADLVTEPVATPLEAIYAYLEHKPRAARKDYEQSN